MHDWFSDRLIANGIGIHYRSSIPPPFAAEQTAIICLHGLTANGYMWQLVADQLAHTYPVIVPDLRGHGLSDKPTTGYTIEEYAADVIHLMDTLRLHAPIVMGHSLGAAVGTVLAAMHPQRVARLILEDPPWPILPTPEGRDEFDQRIADWRATTVQRQCDFNPVEMLAVLCEEHARWQDIYLQPLVDAKFQVSEHVFDSGTDSLLRWPEYIARLRCPTLLLAADTSLGGWLSRETEARIAELNPEIRFMRLSDAGHSIHNEQPDLFLAHVKPFLAG